MKPVRELSMQADDRMNCMEVCGGHGEGFQHFRRPGLDVWVVSLVNQDIVAGGGDLHLISSCASGRITRVLMADICGFGPLFNGVATRLRDVMKRNLNTIRQTRSVRQMSEELADAAQHGGFASALMSTYFAPTRSYTVCNTGHPPPMLFRCRTREWSLLKQLPRNDSVINAAPGVVAMTEYQRQKTTLEVGDMVLACSNSLAETRDHDGQTIGLDGLLRRIGKLAADRPEELPQRLLDGIRAEHAANLSDVDTTIILCQATDTRVNWRDNVLAPFRLLRRATDRTSIT